MPIQWDKAFEAIVNISADAIISIDDRHRIIQFNKGAEDIFGWRADEITGKSIDILIPERFRAGHAQHVRNFGESAVEARRMGERRAIAGLRKNGEEFPAEASISKIVSGDQRVFTVVLRDVTDRKRREEALERAVAARDDVLSFVSHDLGNPLAAIRIATAVLLRDDPDSSLVLGIREAVDHAQRLSRDLLDVQKFEAGKLHLELERLTITDVIDEALRALQPFVEQKNIRVVRELANEIPTVRADRDRLDQALTNLLINAVKFTPANTTVTVAAYAQDAEVLVEIRDQGPGILADDLPYIFDRYWQAQAGKVGHGLGLSIVHAILKAHGGRAWAESTAGEGAKFFIALPAVT